MGRRLSSPEFIGRRQELGVLTAALARAAGGDGCAVLVGGEAGVGKSRLLRELALQAQESGARWVEGDCVDLGDGELPYAPIVAALRALVRDLDEAELAAMLGPARAGLAALLPELAEPGAAVDAGVPGRSRLFELLLVLLAQLAGEAPLVLVVEDLHWADRSTRDFLAYVLRNARGVRVLMVATYRTDELHRRHPLRPFLAETGRLQCVERVEVGRFSRRELAAQLAGILGQRPDPRLVDDLFARSEGNAFFAEELLAAGEGGRVPDSLRDALTLRVDGLPAETQRVLSVAAAAGAGVGYRLLAVAGGIGEEQLALALREAMAEHILVEDPDTGAYGFRHALLREALYDDLLPGEREPLHAALARALERDPGLSVAGAGAAAELAYHWQAAHELPAAFHASIEAGREAEAVFAFAEARSHFERAIGLWATVPQEHERAALDLVELHRRAAEAALLTDDFTRAIALARRALEVVDAERDPAVAALLHESLGRYLWVAGQPDALAEHATAVRLYPAEPPSAGRARVLASQARTLMLSGRHGEAVAPGEQALELARAAGDGGVELSALGTIGPARAMLGDRAGGIALLREGRELAAAAHDIEGRLRFYINLGYIVAMAGELDEGAQITLEGHELAVRLGVRGQGAFLAAAAAEVLTLRGRLDEAETLARDAAENADPGLPGSAVLALLAEVERQRGRAGDARAHVDQALRMSAGAAGAMWLAPAHGTLAALAIDEGRAAEARELVARALAQCEARDDPFYVAPLVATGVSAEAELAADARALGEEEAGDEARRRAEELTAALRARLSRDALPLGGPPPEAVLQLEWCECELTRAHGRPDARRWAALAEGWLAASRPYPAAAAFLHAGEAHVAAGTGGRGEARDTLGRARALAEQLGAAPLVAQVDALARRARIELATEPIAGDDAPVAADRLGLTERELDVLRLVADGRTNREIGAELFISAKTASVHVSRILAKLDVRSRVEAAGVAHRLGLLGERAQA